MHFTKECREHGLMSYDLVLLHHKSHRDNWDCLLESSS